MTERPILFSGPLVRRILAGGKDVTRRLVRFRDPADTLVVGPLRRFETGDEQSRGWYLATGPGVTEGNAYAIRQYAFPGDVLWVRETWAPVDEAIYGSPLDDPMCVGYRADETAREWSAKDGGPDVESVHLDTRAVNWSVVKWRPSIFMPRWACRIRLRVLSVRPERLQEIADEDIAREGFGTAERATSRSIERRVAAQIRGAFSALWDELNGKRATWDSNPWVWRVEFEVTR